MAKLRRHVPGVMSIGQQGGRIGVPDLVSVGRNPACSVSAGQRREGDGGAGMNKTQRPSNNAVLGASKGWDQNELPCGALPITRTECNGIPAVVS